MVESYLDLSMAGIYTISFFFGALILIPSRPLTRISSIIVAESFKKNDIANIRFIYQKSSITLSVIAVWVFLGLLVNMENVYHIIGEDYRIGYYVILLIGLSNVLDMTTGTVNQIIFNSPIYRYSAYMISAFAILLIVSNMILIPLYGIIGAAIATLLSKIIYNALKIGVVKYKLNLFPFTIKSFYPLLIAVFAYYLQMLIPTLNHYIYDIFLRSTVVSLAYLLPIIGLSVSSDINNWVSKITKLIKPQ